MKQICVAKKNHLAKGISIILENLKHIVLTMALAWAGSVFGQYNKITLSGEVADSAAQSPAAFINVVVKHLPDSGFVAGTISGNDGGFSIAGIAPGNYWIGFSGIGYNTVSDNIYVGSLAEFLYLGTYKISAAAAVMNEAKITAKSSDVSAKLDRKTYEIENNISQSGGSLLQAMQNLPGVTVQDGKVTLRGSDKVVILIDGRQTALTGIGSQASLDNIPASAIERIEIINNPSAKFDANGNAGIINIILKKNKQEGFNGKLSMTAGAGALWVKKANLPDIRPQYQATPKINPSLSLNYRKKKVNVFFQGDYFYKPTLNKNEFFTRTYDSGLVIKQQIKRNRNTTVYTGRAGLDWNLGERDLITISGLFSNEKILDRGDEPFFNGDLTERRRLWQFIEDELKTTATVSALYQHKFAQPGRVFNMNVNYTFHRENEKYYFTNIYPSYTGLDSFKLLSDENVTDINLDYSRPLRLGRFETGLKYRYRFIPTSMKFIPGYQSPFDTNAGGWANYKEQIPAVFGTYIIEKQRYEVEAGLRLEYVNVSYIVDPNHNTYKSDGYQYFQPFPNIRLAWKFQKNGKISFFYNRRVDRPNEFDLRVFPKYDDAEIVKIGNPALRPQFTNSFEMGYKNTLKKGYLYGAVYHRISEGTITRIASVTASSPVIYNIMQNAGRSFNTGLECVWSADISKKFNFNVNANVYRNEFRAFTVTNKYPEQNIYSANTESIISGNLKANAFLHLTGNWDVQITGIYLMPGIIPQGKVGARYTIDAGVKKSFKDGKSQFYINATDLFNTMVVRKQIFGTGFQYTADDYYETQVIRVGYSYKF